METISTLVSVLSTLLAGYILSYPMLHPEAQREDQFKHDLKVNARYMRGERVKYFWTDKRLFIIGWSVALFAASVQLVF